MTSFSADSKILTLQHKLLRCERDVKAKLRVRRRRGAVRVESDRDARSHATVTRLLQVHLLNTSRLYCLFFTCISFDFYQICRQQSTDSEIYAPEKWKSQKKNNLLVRAWAGLVRSFAHSTWTHEALDPLWLARGRCCKSAFCVLSGSFSGTKYRSR